MNYQKQYANKINWQNKPSTSTPLNATNLNKMDNALWYIDNALYMLANAVGGGSSIRGGIISSIASNIITTHVTMRTGESLATDELLLLRSNAEGAGNNISIYTDEYSAEDYGLVDLDGEETSVTLTDTSILLLMLDTDEYTATVLGVMDENSGLAGLGIGKMTNYSSGVITTDIDLHRDPVIGDRILLYCSSDISVSNDSIKTYNDGVAVTTDIGPILPQTLVKGFNVLQCVAGIPDGIVWNVKLNVPIVAYSAGTGIMIDNNGVISNANPNYGGNYDYKKIDSAIDDGDLGDFNGYCDNLIIDFHANAVSGGDAYTLTLLTGTTSITRKYAILKDRSGNPFTRDIYAGMILKCESNVSGSGTELDPVVVIVLEIANWYVESGRKANTTIGAKSTAEGEYNTVSGAYGHADGYGNTASGNSASAHGIASTASGDCSVADGSYTTASGANSSAHGDSTIASGVDSSASGEGTIAGYLHQTAMGRFNENKSGNLLEVGNGSDDDNRSNALEVTADGHVLDGNGNDLQSVAALEQSASGNPIIVNAQGIDVKELSVELEPIQDLHGLPFPYVGGAYKNKLPLTADNIKSANGGASSWTGNKKTISGSEVEILEDADGNTLGVKISNTPNATLIVNLYTFASGALSGGYVLNGCPANGADSTYNITLFDGTTALRDKGSGVSFASSDFSSAIQCFIRIQSGYAIPSGGLIFKPMVRLSTESDASFAPYSNECPISGRTEASASTYGNNLSSKLAMSTDANGAISASVGKFYTAVEANKSYVLMFNLKTKMNSDAQANRKLSLYLNDNALLYQWTDVNTIGAQKITITPTASGFLNLWAGNGAFLANTEIIDGIYLVDAEHSHTATIQLGQTVYDAVIDWVTGIMTVNTRGYDMGELNYEYLSDNNAFRSTSPLPDATTENVFINSISSIYKEHQTGMANMTDGEFRVQGGIIYLKDFRFTSASDLKTALSGQTVVYDRATPTTLQLTPSMLKLLEGYNYITADGEMQLVYIPESVLPTAPTTDGTYKLICTVSNGVPTFSWAAN